MTQITFASAAGKQHIKIDELLTLIRGCTIRWVRDESAKEIKAEGLSVLLDDDFELQATAPILSVTLNSFSTTDYLRIKLVSDAHKLVTAKLIEQRLRALRQLYAINFLLYSDRVEELPKELEFDPNFDIEDKLLKDEDRLFISAAAVGSFWVTVRALSEAGVKSVTTIAALFYDEGRQALLRRLRARTESEELDVQKKRLDIDFDRAAKLIEFTQKIDKIKNPVIRQRVLQALARSMDSLEIEFPRLPDTKKEPGRTE